MEDEDICTVPIDDTVEINGHELEYDLDMCTVPIDDTVEINGHELEYDLENAYVEDTEDQDAPESREYLRAPIVDHHVARDIVLDSGDEEKAISCGSSVKNVEEASNKWNLNTLVYRRKKIKSVGIGVKNTELGCGSDSKRKEETSNKWKLNTLVYKRRRSKNVSISEPSILSLALVEKTTTEAIPEAGNHGPVSYCASDTGIRTFEEKIRHSQNKIEDKYDKTLECSEKSMRINLAVDNVAEADSHSETKDEENYVPRQIFPKEFGSVSDSEESRGLSHINALDFVDHFLSVNNLTISENQKSDGRRGGMEKSPPEFSVKGAQTMARRAYLADKPRDLTIFDWDEKEITECNAVKVCDQEFDVRSLGQSPEKDGSETQIIADTYEVGYDTQMAAEAMEALMSAHPPDTSALEFPQYEAGNLFEVGPNKSHICTNLKLPVSQINLRPVQNMSTRNSSKLNDDVSCPLKTHSKYKKNTSQPPKNIICREPLTANSLHYLKPPVVKKVCGKNLTLISRQQVNENLEMDISGVGKNRSSLKCTHDQQREDKFVHKFKKQSSATKRNTDKTLERNSDVSKAPNHCSKRSMNCTLNLDVAKKRRTMSGSTSNKTPGIMSSKRTEQGRSKSGLSGGSMLLKLDTWCLKKQKRTLRGVPRCFKGSANSSTLFRVADEEQNDKYHSETLSSSQTRTSRKGPMHIQEKCMPGSLPNFSPRQLRRRRNETLSVLFSQHLEPDILNQQKKIIVRLGFSVARCCSDATHFVTDRFVRTRNMLEAIALGKPVVTHCWLESCGQANCYVDEKFYILRDAEKEKEIGFSMPVTLARSSKHPLLMGLRVFITPNVKPGVEMIQSLVKSVHGKVVKRTPKTEFKDGCVPNDLLILSCEEDYATCVPLLDNGAAIYNSELLLNGIVIQRLELDRHQLFTNYAQTKCSRRHPKKSEKSQTAPGS